VNFAGLRFLATNAEEEHQFLAFLSDVAAQCERLGQYRHSVYLLY
jgi:hypothetical protein